MEDILYRFLGIYKRAPRSIKLAVGTFYGLLPYSVRYGEKYGEYRAIAAKGRYWTRAEHESYQFGRLKNLLEHAYANVPFYREKYGAAGVSPKDFTKLSDITRFPFITREEIKHNIEALCATNVDKRVRLRTSTSGSSGVPLVLYHHGGVTRPKERAFLYDLFEEFGVNPRSCVAVFRGEIINDASRPWYYDPVDKQLIMSSYRLGPDTISSYVQALRRFRPAAIRGYPFTILRLAQLAAQSGEPPPRLKAVILESENVYEAHRKVISDVFGCPVCHYYGHTERLLFGGNCPASDDYHMHPEYGYMEVVGSDGQAVASGEEGEIVATGFDNHAMPLIRYRTRDRATFSGWECGCGRQFPRLKAIAGREEEYVVLRDGQRVPFHNLLAGIHGEAWAAADKIQCAQSAPGRLLVNVVPAPQVTPETALSIFLAEIRKRVQEEQLALEGRIVDEVAVTRSGKTKLFLPMSD